MRRAGMIRGPLGVILGLGKAVAYLDDVKGRPAALLDEVTSELLAELDPLVDAGTRTLLAAARARVDALRLPAADADPGR